MSFLQALWLVILSVHLMSSTAFVSSRCFDDKIHRLSCRSVSKVTTRNHSHRLIKSLKSTIDDQEPATVQLSVTKSSQSSGDFSSPNGDKDTNWTLLGITGMAIAIPLLIYMNMAHGEVVSTSIIPLAAITANKNIFDPSQFQPVCPASDGVYQVLKLTANSLVGQDNVVEYGPLIASVLLRIRLELCVLESFLYEAVLPFIQKKGLTWVLPLHETVETFLAGTIFAIASNFILLGSTKILSILFIYADALTGMPTRFLGGALKKLPANSVGERVGTVVKFYGDILGGTRGLLESGDTFVGRYLVVATTIYIAFKFAHFKLFNDLIPF